MTTTPTPLRIIEPEESDAARMERKVRYYTREAETKGADAVIRQLLGIIAALEREGK